MAVYFVAERGAKKDERTIPQGECPVDIQVIELRQQVGSLSYTTDEQRSAVAKEAFTECKFIFVLFLKENIKYL